MSPIFLLIGYLIAIAAYFLPAIIAFDREHHFKWVILGMNCVGVLWIPAFIWAIWPKGTTVFGNDIMGGENPIRRSKKEVIKTTGEFTHQDKLDLIEQMLAAGELTHEEYLEKKKKLLDL